MTTPRKSNGASIVPDALLSLYEKIGEATAETRSTGQAVNKMAQKVDSLDGKVDALALVVAAQGHLREDVSRLEAALLEQKVEITALKTAALRREGAVALLVALGGIIAWAAGVFA